MNRILNSLKNYFRDLFLTTILSSITPIPIRRHALKLMGIRVGKRAFINPGNTFNRTNISIGEFCVIGKGGYFDGSGNLEIRERVHIGPNCSVLTATHKIMPSVYRRDHGDNSLLHTIIGRGCWIGTGSIILPGVSIGEGCVIAAGSVVNKDCIPNSLYGGVPAKLIKSLPLKGDRPLFNGIEI